MGDTRRALHTVWTAWDRGNKYTQFFNNPERFVWRQKHRTPRESYISAHVLCEQHAYEFPFALAKVSPLSALFALMSSVFALFLVGSCAGDGGCGISWEETISSTPFSSNAALSAWSTYSLFPSLLVASTRRNHLAAARRVP